MNVALYWIDPVESHIHRFFYSHKPLFNQVYLFRGSTCLSGKCRSWTIESNSDPRGDPRDEEDRQQQRLGPVEEVTQLGTAPVFASADEALDMVRAGLGYLAAADATQLGAAAQARCLKVFEQADAIATAARASFLAAFTVGQGYSDDAAYSARAWLIHQTRVTAGAAVGHTAWARRSGTHPRVLAALAAGQVSASVGRQICLWTDKLPGD